MWLKEISEPSTNTTDDGAVGFLDSVHSEGAAPRKGPRNEMGGKRFTIRPSTSELHCYVTIGSLYVEQLYTDAALELDASTRVAAASGSGAIDLHYMHTVNTFPLFPGTSCFARTLTLRDSRWSLSSYTQTQRSCWTHLHA